MTTERQPETETNSTDHTSAMKRVLAACRDCKKPYTAKYIADGNMQIVGSRKGCPNCGGTDFQELSADGFVQ
ncbi:MULTISPECIES: hypothetical protein [Natrialbaceae]|uniref:hypothetical protein n=1 Tax=Natrialbaceae TaxID=1644061 RepID=UPI00207C77E2|nr:hypothetical protein [Natronococcus sp. CG52]